MLLSKATKSVGLDIGAHSVKAVLLSRAGGRLRLEQAGFAKIDREEMNADPVAAQASAIHEALLTIPLKQTIVVAALPGQTLVIRHPRFPESSDAELARAVDKEADQNIPYELSEVFYDWTLLGKETEGDQEQNKVLLVAARHEVIDSRVQITDAAEVPVHVFGVDSLALADAAEACDFLRTGESVALINIGASGASIHFTKDGLSNYVREVGWGAREMIQAIIKLRRCDYNQAETLLKGIGESEQGDPGAGDAAPSASEDDAHAATEGDQEPQEAPASLLDPLDEELADLEDMPASTTPAKPAPENGGDDLRGALKIPLARLANEVRRSFDYYEQQMYETQIDRVILSGGPAHMPLIRKALADELGMEHVEVADPASSALLVRDERNLQPLLDQPAQYMVAIGLAARGTAEL